MRLGSERAAHEPFRSPAVGPIAHREAKPVDLVVLELDELRLALPIAAVQRVFRAAEVCALPAAPDVILGAIDVHGRLLPVVNLRRKLLRRDREITPTDCFVLARTERQALVLVVDAVEGVVHRSQADIAMRGGSDQFDGVLKLEDGLAVIYDLERFLTAQEEQAVQAALARLAADPPTDAASDGRTADR